MSHTILRATFDISSGIHEVIAADATKKHHIIGIHMTNTGDHYTYVSLLSSPPYYYGGGTTGIFLDVEQHFGLPISLDPPWFITEVNKMFAIWPYYSNLSGIVVYYTE